MTRKAGKRKQSIHKAVEVTSNGAGLLMLKGKPLKAGDLKVGQLVRFKRHPLLINRSVGLPGRLT